MRRIEGMIGRRFGKLTVVREVEQDRHHQRRFQCDCECGKSIVAAGKSLRQGKPKSCGCVKVVRVKHGCARSTGQTKLYRAWMNMRDRCSNPACKKWLYYGGRGIAVCERWQEFANFAADMGEPPTPAHSIDRIDANGNYEPTNCRWATQSEQMQNMRRNRLLTAFGKTQCMSAWSRELGITISSIKKRLNRGWDDVRALTTPPMLNATTAR